LACEPDREARTRGPTPCDHDLSVHDFVLVHCGTGRSPILCFSRDSCYSCISHMKIVPLSIPTPLYVGDVNVYLIKEDPWTLIDVGPKTKEASWALRDKLGREGVQLSDIR